MMLALMPQSPPLPSDLHTPSTMATSTMSVAILPSSPILMKQPTKPAPQHAGPLPSKRPKLSLNTSGVPTLFGKGNTSLRLDTLSTTSPTSRNTFSNAREKEEAQRLSTSHLAKPASLSLDTTRPVGRPTLPTPLRTSIPPAISSTSSSAASATSTSTADSLPNPVPYRLPFNATSILTNGPIPRSQHRRMSFSQSRPMFPAAKKVSFRAPLTEDIKNERYTFKHSDLESSSSTISTLELSPPTQEGEALRDKTRKVSEEAAKWKQESGKPVTAQSPRLGEKRESSDEEDSDGDGDKCPATPVAGRKKRHRQWVWTLGPVEGKVDGQRPGEAGVGEEKAEIS